MKPITAEWVDKAEGDFATTEENYMIAVRQTQEVIAGTVTVKLPPHFGAKRVEVIVLPLEENDHESAQLQHLLLTAPTSPESDLQGFVQVRDWMSRWTVSEF